jgi:riboflavin transporter
MKISKSKSLSTKVIAYTAVFTALSVALNVITIPISILGTAISFTYIPCVLAGIFLGPVPGLLVGLLGDGLGVLIAPKGPWIPLITIGSGMLGLIPGLVFKLKKINPYILIAISFALIYLVTTVTLNTLGIYIAYIAGRKTFWVFLAGRLPMQSLVFGINVALTYGLYTILKISVFKVKKKAESTIASPTTNEAIEISKSENNE